MKKYSSEWYENIRYFIYKPTNDIVQYIYWDSFGCPLFDTLPRSGVLIGEKLHKKLFKELEPEQYTIITTLYGKELKLFRE